MAKRRKASSKKIVKFAPFLVILVVVLLGMVFALFDNYGILSYKDITTFLGLSDKAFKGNEEVKVHFIDVGQGDCTLIESGGTTVLIDAGEMQNDERVCSYLKAQGIKKLDYVIGTHPHSDHIGALATIIQNVDVGTVILPKLPDDLVQSTQFYRNLLAAIRNKNLKITQAVPNEEYDLGGISTLKILGPITENSKNLNDYSIVCKLTHGDNTFLFMGDAEASEEDDLMNANADLKADVLKVGHHGSSTSSKKKFLKAVSPKYCVIMVGAENSFNHPNAKTVTRLTKQTDQIYRTDLLGTIVVESNGGNYKFTFEKGT